MLSDGDALTLTLISPTGGGGMREATSGSEIRVGYGGGSGEEERLACWMMSASGKTSNDDDDDDEEEEEEGEEEEEEEEEGLEDDEFRVTLCVLDGGEGLTRDVPSVNDRVFVLVYVCVCEYTFDTSGLTVSTSNRYNPPCEGLLVFCGVISSTTLIVDSLATLLFPLELIANGLVSVTGGFSTFSSATATILSDFFSLSFTGVSFCFSGSFIFSVAVFASNRLNHFGFSPLIFPQSLSQSYTLSSAGINSFSIHSSNGRRSST